MKVTTKIDESVLQTTVDIVAKSDGEVQKIVTALNIVDNCLTCAIDKVSYAVPFRDILYFESVDKTTFAYTQNEVYEVSRRLYEIEQVMPYQFLRVSKSVILNIASIQKFFSTENGKIIAIVESQEKVGISRFYVKSLKDKLKGVR